MNFGATLTQERKRMSRYEKLAWFNLAIIAGAAAMLCSCMLLMGPNVGFVIAVALGCIGLALALVSIGLVYGAFRSVRKKDASRFQSSDQRADGIAKNAVIYAAAVYFVATIAAIAVVSAFTAGNMSGRVYFGIEIAGVYLFNIAFSILILVSCRKGAVDA